jgi:hypothetical protein
MARNASDENGVNRRVKVNAARDENGSGSMMRRYSALDYIKTARR